MKRFNKLKNLLTSLSLVAITLLSASACSSDKNNNKTEQASKELAAQQKLYKAIFEQLTNPTTYTAEGETFSQAAILLQKEAEESKDIQTLDKVYPKIINFLKEIVKSIDKINEGSRKTLKEALLALAEKKNNKDGLKEFTESFFQKKEEDNNNNNKNKNNIVFTNTELVDETVENIKKNVSKDSWVGNIFKDEQEQGSKTNEEKLNEFFKKYKNFAYSNNLTIGEYQVLIELTKKLYEDLESQIKTMEASEEKTKREADFLELKKLKEEKIELSYKTTKTQVERCAADLVKVFENVEDNELTEEIKACIPGLSASELGKRQEGLNKMLIALQQLPKLKTRNFTHTRQDGEMKVATVEAILKALHDNLRVSFGNMTYRTDIIGVTIPKLGAHAAKSDVWSWVNALR